MSNLSIQLDPMALREATSQAIMGTLTPELREKILRDAIAALLNKGTDSWNRDRTPLHDAFETAVRRIAGEIALEQVKSDAPFMAKLGELLQSAKDKIVSMDTDKLAERMADAFMGSLRSDH